MGLKCLSEHKSKLGLPRVTTGLDKSLNQSPQGGLEKIGYMSSNGPPRNCYKVPNKYLIGHVLGGQNGGSTIPTWAGGLKFEINYMHGVRHVVNLTNKKCACKRWDLTGIPCPHLLAIFDRNMEVKTFVHPCYHVATYKRTYEHLINRIDETNICPKQDMPTVHSPRYHKQPRRLKTLRRREPDEPS